MFKWEYGRQNNGYKKMSLFPLWLSRLIKCDSYLLDLPNGTCVPKHKDAVSAGQKHYRLNFTIKRPSNKSRMYVLGPVKRWWRFELFRPDLYEHGLEPLNGNMYILSFGCCISE